MPNLENLRKQAKQILHWHRERHWPVAAQIRETLPGFEGLSDREILDRPFRLSDAQALVARRRGFETWESLKAGLSAPAESLRPSGPPEVRLNHAIPFIFVADIPAACDFYRVKLGFEVALVYGQPPFYAEVSRDGVRLALRHVDEPVVNAALRRKEALLSASIVVSDAKPLFLEFQAAGVSFFQTLRTEPWGGRTFIVEDPDGNLVAFGGPGE